MRRIAALVLAAIALYLMMPPPPRSLPAAAAGVPVPVRGVVHVHTNRSDGTGSVDDVLRAAAQAGLQFVIVTDHGDGTRVPDLPDYRNGVLYIDAVEISTTNGHLVALGLPKAPYPLAGEARDVVEDVHRLGGIAIAAHPGSPRRELQWTDWAAPIDGLEWLNADSEWRDERSWTLARALLTYPFRPPQALTLLLDRPDLVMRRWDELSQRRRIVALPAADAHARVGARSLGEPYDSAGSLHFPSYVNSFREFSIALSNAQLIGEAQADTRTVLDAIRTGSFYSTIDALAGPAALHVTANRNAIAVAAQAPSDARISLFRNGAVVATAMGGQLQQEVDGGAYRVEVSLPDAPGTPPIPWIVSNVVYVPGPPAFETEHASAAPRMFMTLNDGGSARGWTIEKSAESEGAIDVIGALPGSQLLLRFAISGSPSASPYAAFVMPATSSVSMYDRLMFTARANRPMRLSVQLRARDGDAARWRRSVYLDQTPRVLDLPFAEFTPVDVTSSNPVPLSRIESVLFVIDTVNAKVGSNGQIQIDDIKYAR